MNARWLNWEIERKQQTTIASANCHDFQETKPFEFLATEAMLVNVMTACMYNIPQSRQNDLIERICNLNNLFVIPRCLVESFQYRQER